MNEYMNTKEREWLQRPGEDSTNTQREWLQRPGEDSTNTQREWLQRPGEDSTRESDYKDLGGDTC